MDVDELRNNRVELWAHVRAVWDAADDLVREAKRHRAEQDGLGPPNPREPPKGPPVTYSRQREALRRVLLKELRPALVRHAGEQKADWCLDPLILTIDARERDALGPLVKRWSLPPLQLEMLDIDNGGDAFYDRLEHHLFASDVYPLVFELYLLCLKHGFQGRYEGRQQERQSIIERVAERVRREDPRLALASLGGVTVPTAAPAAEEGGAGKVTFVRFPYRYYVGAVCVAVGVFFGLRAYSNLLVSHSPIAALCPTFAHENADGCQNGR